MKVRPRGCKHRRDSPRLVGGDILMIFQGVKKKNLKYAVRGEKNPGDPVNNGGIPGGRRRVVVVKVIV